MARTKNNQRSANRVAVDVGATGTRPASKGSVVVLVVSVLAAIWAVAMMTAPGRVGYLYFFMYAEYYMGVVSLVSLSITIMVGLVATDRLVLSIRQRVLLQSAHRTTGVIAVGALVVHVWTKIVEQHVRVIDAFIPFLSPGNRLYIGFGTLSALIMVLVMWTGIARSRFVGHGKPWMWRAIHAISYLMWPIALTHGLSAGRPAAAWVVVSYIVCVLGVLIGLAVRLSVSLNRRKDFSSTATAGIKPVGKLVPTAAPAAKKRPGRRDQERVEMDSLGPVAVVDTFRPVSPPPAPPVEDLVAPAAPRQRRGEAFDEPTGLMARPDFEDERPRGRRRADDEIEYDEPRGRRYAGEDTNTRMRRPAELEDTSTRLRRAEIEGTGTRMRRPDLEDTSTRLRRAEIEDTGTRLGRADIEDTGTRLRRAETDDTRAYRADYDEPAPRQRRYADDDEPAPRSRRRGGDMPLYDEPPRVSRHADRADYADRPDYSDRTGYTDRTDYPDRTDYIERADYVERPDYTDRAAYTDRGDYDAMPRQRSRYDDDPPRRRSRSESRYDQEAEDAPRGRRDRGADTYSADSGRHSRSGFVDLVDDDPNYLPPDETPTLIDMASRRARREKQEPARVQAGRGARRAGRGRADDEVADDAYWSQLRGEAN